MSLNMTKGIGATASCIEFSPTNYAGWRKSLMSALDCLKWKNAVAYRNIDAMRVKVENQQEDEGQRLLRKTIN